MSLDLFQKFAEYSVDRSAWVQTDVMYLNLIGDRSTSHAFNITDEIIGQIFVVS